MTRKMLLAITLVAGALLVPEQAGAHNAAASLASAISARSAGASATSAR